MKQCPFCHATLNDEANFCFYCMTSLDEKKPIVPPNRRGHGWLIMVAVVLLLAAVLLLLVLRHGGNQPKSTGVITPTNAVSSEKSFFEETTSEPTSFIPTESKQEETVPSASASNGFSVSDTASDNPPTSLVSEPLDSAKPEGSAPATVGVYQVRNAVKTDDFNLSGTFTQDAVVIIGVTQPPADGVFHVPAVINEKPVVAIMPNAFDSVKGQVKTVILPASIKTVWNYAFAGCTELSHLYLEGKAIYIEALAFDAASRFTLHCSADCSDRNFRYYKNIASDYGALWEEWNEEE